MATKIVGAGDFLVTFVDNQSRHAVVGLPNGSWVIDYVQAFPGNRPILDFTGKSEGSLVFVLDGENKIWAIGLPGGGWSQDYVPKPPFKPVRFVGAGGQYLAAQDDTGQCWIIGGLPGGAWVSAPNIRPPQ